jgi:hypothetical protein
MGAYWSAALEKFSDLHFVLDKKAIEIFFFDENGKVV